jgi:predicted O-methyltransferase YrrM
VPLATDTITKALKMACELGARVVTLVALATVGPLLDPALETLPHVTGPFDLSFIDADKENTAAYF